MYVTISARMVSDINHLTVRCTYRNTHAREEEKPQAGKPSQKGSACSSIGMHVEKEGVGRPATTHSQSKGSSLEREKIGKSTVSTVLLGHVTFKFKT